MTSLRGHYTDAERWV